MSRTSGDRDDFYVGYRKRMPPGLARFTRRGVGVMLLAAALLAVAVPLLHKGYAYARSDFRDIRDFEGVFLATEKRRWKRNEHKPIKYTTTLAAWVNYDDLGGLQPGSPRDYHRVHAPISGPIPYARYIPGTLFPVNEIGTEHIPQLLARNERLAILQESVVHGQVATIMVAMSGTRG